MRGTAEDISISLDLQLFNPSNVRLSMGTVLFEMMYQGRKIGYLGIEDVKLKPNAWSTFTGLALYAPRTQQDKEAGIQLLSAFSSGKDQMVSVRGSDRSSDIKALLPTLKQLEIPALLPAPKNQPLIVNSSFTFPHLIFLRSKARLFAYNPFEVPVNITHIEAEMFYQGSLLGKINETINGFVIPPKGVARSPKMTLYCRLSWKSIQALFNAMKGGIRIFVNSTMQMNVGEYSTPLYYSQDDVLTVKD